MATYQVILDSEIDQDSPITASLMARLRNNPEAVREGDATSPGIWSKAGLIGGTGTDGGALALPTVNGVFRYDSLTDLVGATLGNMVVILCTGDVNLAGATINLGTISPGNEASYVATARAMWKLAQGGNGGAQIFGGAGTGGFGWGNQGSSMLRHPVLAVGGASVSASDSSSAGGGSYGNGGNSGTPTGSGNPSPGSGRGGLVIIAEGNVDLSGTTINGNGTNGSNGGDFGGGGGGAGGLRVFATGTVNLTGAVFNFGGGNGSSNGGGGGGGGSTYVAGVSITGSPSVDVGGGTSGSGAGNGGAGASLEETMAIDVLRGQVHDFMMGG